MRNLLTKTIRTYTDGRVEEILPFKTIYERDSQNRITHSKTQTQESWYSYDGNHGKVVFNRTISYMDNVVLSTVETAYKYDGQARLVMEKITKDGVIHTYTMKYNEHGQTERAYNGVIVESTEYNDDGSTKRFCTYEEGILTTIDEYFGFGNMKSTAMNPNGSWKEEVWYNNETSEIDRRVETYVGEDGTTVWNHSYITDETGHNYAYYIKETLNGNLVSATYYKGYYMIERQTPEYTEVYEYSDGK